MAKTFTYKLREDLSRSQLTTFVEKLQRNHRLINKGYLQIDTYPKIPQIDFEVYYDKEKSKLTGNLTPRILLSILVQVQTSLWKLSQVNGSDLALPIVKASDYYKAFYFQGDYYNTVSEGYHKIIIKALHKVVTGEFKKQEGEEKEIKSVLMHELSYSFRQGNLLDNWSKSYGVRAFATYIKKLKDGEPYIDGSQFRQPDGEYYAVEHGLESLSEYHHSFKKLLPSYKNYSHPKDSSEKKALSRLEKINYPFFSGRGILQKTVIASDQLTGKLATDNINLDEFIKIFDDAIKALKTIIPVIATSTSDDDIEGGGDDDPDLKRKKRDPKDLIDDDSLYELVRTKLVSFLYINLYKDKVLDIDDSSIHHEVRSFLLGEITKKIDSKIVLRNKIKDELSSNWIDSYNKDESGTYNDSFLEKQIEEFVKKLSQELNLEEFVDGDIEAAKAKVDPESVVDRSEPPKIDISTTSGIIVAKLIEEKIVEEDFSVENWEQLPRKDKIKHWTSLSISERREFLKEIGFDHHINAYAENIALRHLEDQLSRSNVSLNERSHFGYLLGVMQDSIAQDLLIIPPSDLSGRFSDLDNKWSATFGPAITERIIEFKFTNPKNLRHSDLVGKSFDEIALLINKDLNITRVNDLIDSTSNLLVNQEFNNLNLPKGVRLDLLDRSHSVSEIDNQLREYLLNNPEALHLLLTEDLTHFINQYSNSFVGRMGSRFLPLLEERAHEAHRQFSLKQVVQKAGKNKLIIDDTLHYIITQSIISQVNPEDYIKSLSNEELAALFGIQAGDYDNIDLFGQEIGILRDLVLDYMHASRKTLDLNDKIENAKKIEDVEDFNDDLLFLREQGRRLGAGGGRVVYSVMVEEEEDPDTLIALGELSEGIRAEEAALEAHAKDHYIRQRNMAIVIYQAYSDEEKALLEAQHAQDLAIYEQQLILNQKAGGKRSKKQKRGALKAGFNAGKDKLTAKAAASVAGAVANILAPGSGVAVSAFINALPISDKYKKYLVGGALGVVTGFGAATVHLFTTNLYSTIFGSIGAIGGGIAGFFSAGFAGIIPGATAGWVAGTWGGFALSGESFFGGSSAAAGASAPSLGAGISGTSSLPSSTLPSTTAAGASGTASATGLANATVASGQALGSVVVQATVATAATAYIGGILVTENLHSGFLQRPPELLNYAQDSSSKYVQVDKVAIPSKLENEQKSDIKYSVTISPNEGYIITVDQVADEISILGSGSDRYDFSVDQAQITEQLQPNTEISEPITIEYTLPNVSGVDIAINNTFILDFFVEEEGEVLSETARGSAIVTIGNPELGCFQFGEAGTEVRAGSQVMSIAWGDSDKTKIVNAYSRILNNTKFMSLICSDGAITFYRIPGSQYGGWALSANSIGIYNLGVTSQNSATYTTIHELGHLMDYRNPGLRSDFQANWTGTCFTYPYECYAGEPFAEAVALYEIYDFYVFAVGGKYDFPRINPKDYDWIESNIYGGGN